MNPIIFFVEGEPRPKQSFRATRNGGGYTPARIKAWQGEVGVMAQKEMRRQDLFDPLVGNLTLELIFFLGDYRRVDLDNLSKAVQDGMNHVVYEDDKQNIRLTVDKYICLTKQGVLIKITQNERSLEINEPEMEALIWSAELEGAQ